MKKMLVIYFIGFFSFLNPIKIYPDEFGESEEAIFSKDSEQIVEESQFNNPEEDKSLGEIDELVNEKLPSSTITNDQSIDEHIIAVNENLKNKDENKETSSLVGFSIAYKPTWFYSDSKLFRDFYDTGLMSLFEASYYVYDFLQLFTEVGYFHKKKKIQVADARVSSSVTVVPLTLGLTYSKSLGKFFKNTDLTWYLRAGPNTCYLKTWVNIPGLKRTQRKWFFGATFGSGFKIVLQENIYIDLLLNYRYDRRKINDATSGDHFRRSAGGMEIGAGLGYTF